MAGSRPGSGNYREKSRSKRCSMTLPRLVPGVSELSTIVVSAYVAEGQAASIAGPFKIVLSPCVAMPVLVEYFLNAEGRVAHPHRRRGTYFGCARCSGRIRMTLSATLWNALFFASDQLFEGRRTLACARDLVAGWAGRRTNNHGNGRTTLAPKIRCWNEVI